MNLLRRSWQIGRFRGVEIRLHISMLLAVPFMLYLFEPKSQRDWFFALFVMGGFFISILLHEMGHALMAQWFKIGVKQILIWPLGGFTQFVRPMNVPVQQFLVSFAGPMVNLLIGLVLGVLWLTSLLFWVWHLSSPFWANLIYDVILSVAIINGLLAVFNLLPIYLLDGGHILHSLVELFFGRRVSDAVSILVGIPFLFGLILLCIYLRDPFTLLICLVLALGLGTLHPLSLRWINLAVNYLFQRTAYYHLTEDYDAALLRHTLVLEKNPNDIPNLLGRAGIYINLDQKELAIADVETVLRLEPDQFVALEFCGEIHALQKEYPTALEYYARVKTLKPDWAFPYFDIGGVYFDQMQYEQALIEFDRAIALQPQQPIFFLARSMAHFQMKNLEAAHRDQAEAIRLSDQIALVMSDVNLVLYEDRIAWAQDYYGWVVKKFPRQWQAYLGRADALSVDGQWTAALADYAQAIALAPHQALPYLRRGLANQKAGNIAQAIDDFQQVLLRARKSHLRRRAKQLLEESQQPA